MSPECSLNVPSAAEGLFLGASPLGAVLMLLFFATVGAGAGSLTALVSNLYTLAFIAIQLAVSSFVRKLGM
jgi:hypothetical protein